MGGKNELVINSGVWWVWWHLQSAEGRQFLILQNSGVSSHCTSSQSQGRLLVFSQAYDLESVILVLSKCQRIKLVGINKLKFSVRRKVWLARLWIIHAVKGRLIFSIKWQGICLRMNWLLKVQTWPWWCLKPLSCQCRKKKKKKELKTKEKASFINQTLGIIQKKGEKYKL